MFSNRYYSTKSRRERMKWSKRASHCYQNCYLKKIYWQNCVMRICHSNTSSIQIHHTWTSWSSIESDTDLHLNSSCSSCNVALFITYNSRRLQSLLSHQCWYHRLAFSSCVHVSEKRELHESSSRYRNWWNIFHATSWSQESTELWSQYNRSNESQIEKLHHREQFKTA